MGKIIYSLGYAVYNVMDILQWLFFIRAILSWFPNLNQSKFSYFLYELTEPFIKPVRSMLSRTQLANSMLDFSFLITFFLLIIIQNFALVLIV